MTSPTESGAEHPPVPQITALNWQTQLIAGIVIALLPTGGSAAVWSSTHALGEKVESIVASQQRLELDLAHLRDERAGQRLDHLEERLREMLTHMATLDAEDKGRDSRLDRLDKFMEAKK